MRPPAAYSRMPLLWSGRWVADPMRVSKREVAGYWLAGALGGCAAAAFVSLFVWGELRSTTEHMEGGWTRTVYDNTSYLGVCGWACGIALALWTLGFVSYWLMEGTK